jgi:hypothetical protein
MPTARRELVLAAISAALATITGVAGVTVERNRAAPVDGDKDLDGGPMLVLSDGDQVVADELAAFKLYRATPSIDAYVRGADAGAASVTLEALYAEVVTVLETDAALAALVLRVRAGEMEPGLDLEAGHRAVVGFGIRPSIEYETERADPYAVPS